jgi:hypothetical protein
MAKGKNLLLITGILHIVRTVGGLLVLVFLTDIVYNMGVSFSPEPANRIASFMATIGPTMTGVVAILYLILPGIVGVVGLLFHNNVAKSELCETLAIINFLMFGILLSVFVLLGAPFFDLEWPSLRSPVYMVQYMRDNSTFVDRIFGGDAEGLRFFDAAAIVLAEFFLHNFFFQGAKRNSGSRQAEGNYAPSAA